MNILEKYLDSKQKIRTVFIIYILFFLMTSFVILTDVSLPSIIYKMFQSNATFNIYRSMIIKNQGIILIALLGVILISYYHLKIFDFIARYNIYIIFIGVILVVCIITPLVGIKVNGARRWIRIPPGIVIQPSEFAKIAIIYLAFMYSRTYAVYKKKGKEYLINKLFFISLILFLFLGTIIIGKAFTNTLLLLILFNLLLLFTNSMSILYFLVNGILALIGGLVYYIIYGSYIRQRFIVGSANYQVQASHDSLTLGGMFGSGLYNGIMKFFYLPERDTDYILSIIGEHFGFVGLIFLILLFISFSIFLYYISTKTKNLMYKVISMGFSFIILNQFLLHLVINTTNISTGVPLPFYSNGGSFSMVLGLLIIMESEVIDNLELKGEK